MNKPVILIEKVLSPKSKILFLGYSREQTSLIDNLVSKKCEIWHTDEKIQSTVGYDLVISYGYKHILKKEVIESSKAPIVNLHISYLPWNRGAHPNFWSFYECTPSGVSIHLIDEGVDSGAIIYQRYVNYDKEENTFSKTYKKLIVEIEKLFRDNIDELISKKFIATPQRCKGSYHSVANLPKEFLGWDSVIKEEVVRLDSILNKK
jgi:methionyl-tRNA formyltransferase